MSSIKRGVQQRVDVKYVSDRGQEFIISEMEDSHILNVIIHHRRQRDALIEMREHQKGAVATIDLTNITKRIVNLDNTILVLFSELMKRDPDRPELPTGYNPDDYGDSQFEATPSRTRRW